MRLTLRIALSVLALSLALTAPALHAETVDNPAYKGWASFRPGSTVTLTSSRPAGATTVTTQITHTLAEVTPEHVVVETVRRLTVNGQVRTIGGKETIEARTQKHEWKEAGTEDVQAAGKTFKCKIFEITSATPGGPGGKIWSSDEVPGGVVQIRFTTPAGNATTEATYLLKSYDVK